MTLGTKTLPILLSAFLLGLTAGYGEPGKYSDEIKERDSVSSTGRTWQEVIQADGPDTTPRVIVLIDKQHTNNRDGERSLASVVPPNAPFSSGGQMQPAIKAALYKLDKRIKPIFIDVPNHRLIAESHVQTKLSLTYRTFMETLRANKNTTIIIPGVSYATLYNNPSAVNDLQRDKSFGITLGGVALTSQYLEQVARYGDDAPKYYLGKYGATASEVHRGWRDGTPLKPGEPRQVLYTTTEVYAMHEAAKFLKSNYEEVISLAKANNNRLLSLDIYLADTARYKLQPSPENYDTESLILATGGAYCENEWIGLPKVVQTRVYYSDRRLAKKKADEAKQEREERKAALAAKKAERVDG